MAVNYASKRLTQADLSPYVLPVSLELLAKVNAYKQSQFYQNAQKISESLGELSSLDIINPTQKQYANDAVSSVINKIKTYGPIDFSDMSIANSIENLGTEVYKDANIINGIASTKKVRQMQANYQKMANDPKLSKYYNPAYEKFDEEFYIKPYVTSNSLQATYDGPVNPTIYTGNPLEKAIKLVKQSRPEIVTEYVNGKSTGGYINVVTKERYTPETLVSSFDSVIDGQTKTELLKNAWYTLDYSNRKADGTPVYDENGYAKMLSDQSQQTLDNLEATLKANNEAILSSGLDADARKQIQQTIKQTEAQIASLNTSRKQNDDAFRSTFRKDKLSALYQLYVGGLKHNLYNIFGAEQQKLSMKPDLAQLQEYKKEIAYINKGYNYQGMNADGTPRLKPVPGTKEAPDPKTDFTVVDINTETGDEAEKNKITLNTIATENNNVYAELNASTFDYIKKAAIADNALYDALQFKLQPTVDANSAPYTYSSTVLNKIAQGDANPNLSIEDLERSIRHKDELGLTPKAVTFIQGVVDSYNKIVHGVDNDQPIDAETRKFMNIYQDKMSIVNSNNKLVADVRNKVIARDKNLQKTKGLFGSEVPASKTGIMQQYGVDEKFMRPDGSFSSAAMEDYSRISRLQKDMFSKANSSIDAKVNEAINKELEAISNRNNYFSIVLREDTDKLKIKELIPGLENLIKITNKDVMDGQDYKDETIQPIALTKSPEGWRVSYTIKDKKDNIYYSVANRNVKGDFKDIVLTNEQAQQLGAQIMPYEGLEREAYVNGSSTRDYFVPNFFNIKTDGTVAKNPKPVKIQVVRTTNSRNNNNYAAKIFIPSLNQWKLVPFDRPEDAKYAATANSAYYYAASLLDNYSKLTDNGEPVTDQDGNIIKIRNAETFYTDFIVPRTNR